MVTEQQHQFHLLMMLGLQGLVLLGLIGMVIAKRHKETFIWACCAGIAGLSTLRWLFYGSIIFWN